MPRFASYWLRRWISKAKNKIFLVDVETIVSRLPCASMKLLSWNQVFKTKKDCWNVWIRTFKTQQIWRCYKYYSPPHRITRACRLADTASAWKLRGILNLACPCRSKTEQNFHLQRHNDKQWTLFIRVLVVHTWRQKFFLSCCCCQCF